MKICGTSGPSADGKDFDYGWKEMKRLKLDLVDEHYYKPPQWFFDNAGRYDSYDRKGPKVFAGEYAAHGKGEFNNWEAALSEAAFMTGLERNADVVYQATYAPLFAHVEGWQWKPDLIWFDNLKTVRSANWYVQMLYGVYKGTHVIGLTENGKAVEGADGLYASAVYDKNAGAYYVKIANALTTEQQVSLQFKGMKQLSKAETILLTARNDEAENTLANDKAIVPQTVKAQPEGNVLNVKMPKRSFVVVKVQP